MKTFKRLVESTERRLEFEHRGIERIPGTNKVRTYCANGLQYSKESDFERITDRRSYTSLTREKF